MPKTQLYLGTLLGLQLLLGAGIFVSQSSSGSGQAPEPLLQFAPAEVDRIAITGADQKTTTLQRADGQWQLADSALPANQSKVQTLLENLGKLQTSWPVANTGSGRERFEVSEDKFQRHLTLAQGDSTLGELYFGTSPGFRQTHGRRADDAAVYSLAFNSIDLPTDQNDWLDKTLLGLEGFERIEGSDFVLRKDGEAWQLENAAEGQSLDQEKAKALAGALDNLRVLRLLDSEPVAAEGEAREEHSLRVSKGEQQWQYTLAKVGNTAFVGRDDLPQRFTLSSADYDKLAKASLQELLAVAATSAGEAAGDRLQFLHAFDITFEGFAPGAGARGAARVGGSHDDGVGMLDAEVVVMPGRGADDLRAFAVAFQQISADLRVAAFGFMVGGFADVVQQAAASGQPAV